MSRAAVCSLWLLATLLCAAVEPARAQESEDEVVSLRLGFDNTYKLGCWVPAEVTLQGGSERSVGLVAVTVPDSDGVPTTYTTPADRPVGLNPNEETVARLLVRVGKLEAAMKVEYFDADGLRAKRTFYGDVSPEDGGVFGCLAATDRMTLLFGPDAGTGRLVRSSDDEAAPDRLVRIEDPAALPTHWLAYEGVETVALLASESETYRPLLQSRERLRALERWVRLGGRLVVFCGGSAPELLAADGALAGLVPGRLEDMVQLRDPQALQTFADTPEEITPGRFSLAVPKLTDVTGEVLAHAGREETSLPLVVRSAMGLGEVTFVALDMDKPPIRDWPGRTVLMQKALRLEGGIEAEQDEQTNQYAYQSGTDLVGTLRTALDGKFVGVRTVPFGIVALLVVGYILMIGPGDYFLVSRVLKRMELTWVTFPLMVVGVSAAAYFLGNWFKGDQLRVNQVELLDVDTTSGTVRGTVWTHLFSPKVDRFDLSLTPAFGGKAVEANETAATWLGMPGYGLGGLQMQGSRGSLLGSGYATNGDRSRLLGVPVQVWSTKTLTARWESDATELIAGNLKQSLDGELVEGPLENLSEVDFSDCVLVYGRWAYNLSKLPAGRSLSVNDEDYPPRSVKTLLTNATAGDETTTRTADDGTVPFDWQQSDVSRILKSMMFYDAIKGRKYTTGRVNRYQHFVDLSHLLTPDRAVLLARAPGPGSQWVDGDQPLASEEDRHWVYYRFVLEVQPSEP